MVRHVARILPIALIALGLLILLISYGQLSYPRLRPVNITHVPEEGTLVSEPSDYTVVLMGRITDEETGESIHNATTVVVTVTGSHLFRETANWTVMFPAKSVIEIAVTAPGYESTTKQLRAHYDRNVTLDIEVKLEPKREPGPET